MAGRDFDPATGQFVRGTRTGRATQYQRGNPSRLTHGAELVLRRGLTALPAAMRADLEAFEAGLVADQGGAPEIPTLRRELIRTATVLVAQIDLLAGYLSHAGALSATGRLRPAFTALLAVVDRFDKVAKTLGLDRRQGHAETLEGYLSRAYGDTTAPEAPGGATADVDREVENEADRALEPVRTHPDGTLADLASVARTLAPPDSSLGEPKEIV